MTCGQLLAGNVMLVSACVDDSIERRRLGGLDKVSPACFVVPALGCSARQSARAWVCSKERIHHVLRRTCFLHGTAGLHFPRAQCVRVSGHILDHLVPTSCDYNDIRRARKPKGYWSDMRNIENEILELQKRAPAFESGFMPVARELRAAGRRDLDNAITKIGGYAKVADALGLTRSSGKRTAGFWRDFANLESALRAFLKENATEAGEQTMPTQKELRRLGRSDIESALEQHGGTAEVAKKLGLAPASSKKSKHYWKDWAKVKAEVMQFVDEREAAQLASRSTLPTAVIPRVARMPSQKELRAAGKGDLAEAISSYHGGFRHAASKLGLISKKKDDHYYDHFYNVALEIYALVAAVGSESIMPSTAVLKCEGRTDLAAAIVKFGGMSKVSQRLGLKYRVRTREAFKDWSFFRRSLLAFAERHGKPGEIPSSRTLTNFGRDDLYQAILHHGGTRDVADKMGLKRNFWQDFHNVGMQVLEFVGTHGTAGVMPTENEFLEVGRSALNLAVSKFGHSQVAQRLGLKKPSQSPQVALDAFLNQSMSLDIDYGECDEEDYLDDTHNSEVETSTR